MNPKMNFITHLANIMAYEKTMGRDITKIKMGLGYYAGVATDISQLTLNVKRYGVCTGPTHLMGIPLEVNCYIKDISYGFEVKAYG